MGTLTCLGEVRRIVRASRPLTRLLGPMHLRSLENIEIDLTYECNVKCVNCNRSCRQAPSSDRMTVMQVRKFIGESVRRNMRWQCINLLGGEPTLHPAFMEILSDLTEYKRTHSPSTKLKVSTNGHGEKVNEVLAKIPDTVEVDNSRKQKIISKFVHFNVAPRDLLRYRLADYSNGCRVAEKCGIGLTPYGYYCCAIAGGIDRVFGYNLGRKSLPLESDFLVDQMRAFCGLCGHFITNERNHTDELMSKTWSSAYKEYASTKPRLSLY